MKEKPMKELSEMTLPEVLERMAWARGARAASARIMYTDSMYEQDHALKIQEEQARDEVLQRFADKEAR